MTAEGPKIRADQVVTAEADMRPKPEPAAPAPLPNDSAMPAPEQPDRPSGATTARRRGPAEE